jgi:hypothetical protein
MRFIGGLLYSGLIFLCGWLFNFVFDIQFALGMAAGWFLKEGYDNIGRWLQGIAG